MSKIGLSAITGRISIASTAFFVGLVVLASVPTQTLAQECDKSTGKIGGAVIGGATGSLFGSNKGQAAAAIGGAVVGGVVGSRRDERMRARCLEEREAAKDRDMQRQLEYDRQRMLQEEQVRREIEEQRLYEEWKRERMNSPG